MYVCTESISVCVYIYIHIYVYMYEMYTYVYLTEFCLIHTYVARNRHTEVLLSSSDFSFSQLMSLLSHSF